MRGAARQFGARIVDYQSCNLGDAATMYSREAFFYPASSRYILDNQYDAWAGAGTNWLLKDYLLWYLAGAEAFYHEEGVDIFWKPGGYSMAPGYDTTINQYFQDVAHDSGMGTNVYASDTQYSSGIVSGPPASGTMCLRASRWVPTWSFWTIR